MRTEQFPQVAWMALLGLVVGGLVWSTPVLAAETKARRTSACTADEQKFCPDAKTAKNRTQCLKSHEADLSQGCQDLRARAVSAGAKKQAKTVMRMEVCKSDSEILCKDVKAGRAMTQCLQSHEAELSVECKDTLPKSKKRTT